MTDTQHDPPQLPVGAETAQPRSILKEGAAYGLVGGLQLVLDWGCFVALTALGLPTVASNMSGRVVGALIGFWLNGVVTFRGIAGGRLGWVRFRRFLASWAVMSAISTLAVHQIDKGVGLHWAWLLKPAVDVALAALGFLASRFWIYR